MSTASIAGLPGCSASVIVGPPLLVSDPSSGFVLFRSPVEVKKDIQELSLLRFEPLERMGEPFALPQLFGLPPARIVSEIWIWPVFDIRLPAWGAWLP